MPPSELARAARLVDQVLRQLLLFNGTGFSLNNVLNTQGSEPDAAIVTPDQ